MFSQDDLQELLEFDAGDSQVLSLYLNANTAVTPLEQVKLQIRSLIKETGTEQSDDAEAVERYFEYSFPWTSPGVAVFSCADRDFFRAFPVAVAFRNRARLRPKPYVKPLVHLLDHYAHYGVIVVDRIGARFFEFHLGELQETRGTMGEDIRKQKHGAGSSLQGMRGGQTSATAEDEQVQRNMREAAAAAARFFNRRAIRRLFIAGTPANVAQFKEYLPRQLQSCYAGTFPMDMDASEAEVRDRSLELLREINSEREHRLVKQMIARAASGGPAVTGLAPTLRMVSDGRVDTLIISDGYRSNGFLHRSTGYLTVTSDDELFGDGEYQQVEDVIEAAVTRTLEQSGHVELVTDNSELEMVGRIGAILRY